MVWTIAILHFHKKAQDAAIPLHQQEETMKIRFTTLMFALLVSVSAMALMPAASAVDYPQDVSTLLPHYRSSEAKFPTYDYEKVCHLRYDETKPMGEKGNIFLERCLRMEGYALYMLEKATREEPAPDYCVEEALRASLSTNVNGTPVANMFYDALHRCEPLWLRAHHH